MPEGRDRKPRSKHDKPDAAELAPAGELIDTSLTGGRRFLDRSGRIKELRVAGEIMPDQMAERVVDGSISLSTSAIAELALTFDDPDYALLKSHRLALDVQLNYAGLDFEVAGVEADGSTLAIAARDATWRQLRRSKGAELTRNVSASEWLAERCKRLAINYTGQDSPKRKNVGRHGKETDATAAARMATELGYVLFAAAGRVYFGQPTWLMAQADRLVVGRRSPWLRSPPSISLSADDKANAATIDVEVEPELGDRLRPGMALELADFDGLEGPYLVNTVGIGLNVGDPVAINASTPVNPDPQPPGGKGGPGGSSSSSTGGSRRIGDLLRYVGFEGEGLRIATGVSVGESGLNATILGDTTITDAKWGPSVGLFQIRSLRRPGDYSGVDALRVQSKLTDAIYNAKTAFKLSNGGRSWGPWSVFTSGAYQSHMDEGDRLVTNWGGLPGTSGGGGAGDVGGGSRAGMVWPTTMPGTVTSNYGVRGGWAAGYHTGIDLGAPMGTKIVSAHSGVVNFSGYYDEYGGMVRVRVEGHDVMYCHLMTTEARVGQSVRPGTFLGKADDTGRSFGSHLHFEVRPAGAGYGGEVNPGPWLPAR